MSRVDLDSLPLSGLAEHGELMLSLLETYQRHGEAAGFIVSSSTMPALKKWEMTARSVAADLANLGLEINPPQPLVTNCSVAGKRRVLLALREWVSSTAPLWNLQSPLIRMPDLARQLAELRETVRDLKAIPPQVAGSLMETDSGSTAGLEPAVQAILAKARAKEIATATLQRTREENDARFRRALQAWQAVASFKGDAIPVEVTGGALHRLYAERIVELGQVLKADGWQERLDAVKPGLDAKTYAVTMLRRAMDGNLETVITMVREGIYLAFNLGLEADKWLREGLMYEVLNIQPAPEPPLGWEGKYLEPVETVDDFIKWIDSEFLVQEIVGRGQGDRPSNGQLVRNAFRLVLKLDLRGMPPEPTGAITLNQELAILRNLRRLCSSRRIRPEADRKSATSSKTPEDPPLTGSPGDDGGLERENEILRALLMLKADSERRATSRLQAARKVDPNCIASSYNKAVASLVTKGLVKSKRGPSGGIWLTPAGVAAAQALVPPS